MREGYIYGLFDPDEPLLMWNCRYIGQTVETLRVRLRRHIADARRNEDTAHRNNWMRTVLARENEPEPIIRLLERVNEADLNNREITWIAWGRKQGWDLTNISDGGLAHPQSPETRAKISATRLERQIRHTPETIARLSELKLGSEPWNKGLTGVYSDEHIEKIKAARALQTFSDETRQKLSEAGKNRVLTEEHKAKISESRKGISPSPEARAKISATLTGRKNGPPSEETRAKISAANQGRTYTEDTLQRMSEAADARWEEPGARAAYSELMSEVMADPEIRQRVSDGQKARYTASDKSLMDCPDCGKGPYKGEWGLAAHKQFCKGAS